MRNETDVRTDLAAAYRLAALNGWDDTVYTVPAATVRVVATLYYQTASSDYIDFLRELGGPDGEMMGILWDDDKSPPVVVAQETFPAPNESFIPLTRGQ